MTDITNSFFSVIIPNYNMGRFIDEALQSIDAQSFTDWEIIVVDDCGPHDGAESIVQQFASAHPEHRVEFIRHERNTGVSGARNTAVGAARGEFLAFLDPDDLWKADYLEKMAVRLRSETSIDIVSSPAEAFRVIGGKMVADPLRIESWQIKQFPDSLSVSCFILPSATVARRTSVEAAGGFDTSADMQHIEDYDLWIKLVLAGAKFSFITENISRYRRHENAATSDAELVRRLHQRIARKHPDFFIAGHAAMYRTILGRVSFMEKIIRNPFKAALLLLRGYFRKMGRR